MAPGLILLCIGCSLRNAAGNIWGYNVVLYYRSQGVSVQEIALWLSWLPMVAGALGSMLGGYFSDKVIEWRPDGGRLLLLTTSCCFSAPLMALAILLPAPFSFLCLIPGYAIAEMWLGVAMTIMVGMVPDNMRTSSVALYLFFVDNLGSLGLLVVQPVKAMVGFRLGMLIMVPGIYFFSGLQFWAIQPIVSRNVKATKEKAKELSEEEELEEEPNEETPIVTGTAGDYLGEEHDGKEPEHGRRTPQLRRRTTRGVSMVDLLDMVQADICWHRGHECMVCTCTRPKRF